MSTRQYWDWIRYDKCECHVAQVLLGALVSLTHTSGSICPELQGAITAAERLTRHATPRRSSELVRNAIRMVGNSGTLEGLSLLLLAQEQNFASYHMSASELVVDACRASYGDDGAPLALAILCVACRVVDVQEVSP